MTAIETIKIELEAALGKRDQFLAVAHKVEALTAAEAKALAHAFTGRRVTSRHAATKAIQNRQNALLVQIEKRQNMAGRVAA
jgi:hypothetical protein